jgi:hypothetical protein
MQNSTGTAVQPHLSVPQETPPAGGSTHGSDRAITLGLLGPLLLIRGGRQITPSAPKLRLVLSLLAVQANSVTRVDQLVEELWGESPPPSALTTVQTYIYQLRKLLKLDDAPPADGPARPALLSHPGGYILQLPDLADVDANLFELLARRGRTELLGAHAEAAAETFRDALALWRGNVLEGVRVLGVPDVPESPGEAALLFRSWTADRRLLVVLNKASDEHLPHHLFPTGAGCAVVVVSRAPVDALSGAVRLRVPALSTVEAVELLAAMIGQGRVDQECAAAVELVELADRLPLALRAVGARLAARPG